MKKNSKNQLSNLVKGFSCLLIFLIISLSGFSQNAGISSAGAVPPDASAGLDVNFTNQGLLIPRIALTSTSSFLPLSAHVPGMIVYNTSTVGDVTPGFYYNDGTKWVAFAPGASAAGDMQYWDGTSWKVIPIGTPGQFLKLNGSGVPVWAP